MKIPLFVEADDDDNSLCNKNCIFLDPELVAEYGYCLLFGQELKALWRDNVVCHERCKECRKLANGG